jgi:hypothetical protein
VQAEPAIFASVVASGALLTGGAFALAGAHAGSSAAAGAIIAAANLWALRGIIRVLVASAAGARSSSGIGFFLAPKLLALFGLVWLLLSRHVVSAGPLALGYAALPIGVAIGALVCEKPAP